MNCLIFNDEFYVSDGNITKKIAQGDSLAIDGKARIAYVDIDVMVASAPQDYLEKKDGLLAQKFSDLYASGYITIHERIDNNVFQVMGIKDEKVKEVYSLIPSPNVDVFVPYAMALRSLLLERQMDMCRLIVFVDDCLGDRLITVFDGLKFSRTRALNNSNTEELLSDIKRSVIDFNKKLGEFASKQPTGELTLISNNEQIVNGIKILEPLYNFIFLDVPYPALEGLNLFDSQTKYRVPEEIILERKNQEFRSNVIAVIVAICLCLGGGLFFGFNQIAYSFVELDLKNERIKNTQLRNTLEGLDGQIYQDALRQSKNLNYSSLFFKVSGLLPNTYEIASFKFSRHNGSWLFDAYLLPQEGEFYDEIPRINILKDAIIKDFFIKNRPGKYLRLAL